MSDTTTPSSRWAADGQRDPHGDRYACERAALALGNLTDDELANAVFLHGNEQPTMADMAAGKALAGIVYLTAAKDRIRWLSRRLAAATTPQPAELAEQQVDALRERTPADFAIEHAGYLANASTRLLKACGELDSLVMRRDEHDDVDDSDMHAAQDRVDEASDSVRSAIYEFEKRRDRALAATGKQHVGEVESVDDDWRLRGYAYASKQATTCAGCGKHKHTPLRIDAMGGYVCLTCIDQKLGSLLDEFGYLPAQDGELQGDALYIEWLKERISSIYSTVSLGHQTGPYAYAGEDFSRYLTEAASDCRKIMRVLSALAAQPSPAGQGAVPCATSASHALRVAYRHLDMVSMRVSHCKDASIIESAMKDVDTFDLNAAISALADRQPGSQEPVGMMTACGFIAYTGFDELPVGTQFYAAPPAQGIDPGQLRALAEQWKQLEYPFSYEGNHAQRATDACCADLLALIDQSDAAPGVANA